MSNPLHPDHMTAAERTAELFAILAAGVIRVYGTKSSDIPVESGEISLDFVPDQSGPVPESGNEEPPK
jgi:hypothetical protein